MKYAVFAAAALAGVPFAYWAASRSRAVERLVFFLAVFFTCEMVDINFVSRETYRITTRGFEIGFVDLTVLVLFLLLRSRRDPLRPAGAPPGSMLFLAYTLSCALSIVNAPMPLFSLFEVSKMARMLFYLWVMYEYLDSYDKICSLLSTIGAIAAYVLFTIVRQKYLQGMFQARGPFPHQNSLVMYMTIYGAIVLSYLLNAPRGRLLWWLCVFGMAAMAVISTLSRMGLVCFAVACAVVVMVSFAGGLSSRKIVVFSIVALIALAGLAKAYDSVVERFSTAPKESAEVRVLLARAACRMANDKLLGVGLNNFGIAINPPFPYGDHIEHSQADEDADVKNGLVETVYLMVAAECGWHTLALFLTMLVVMYWRNARNVRTMRNTPLAFVPIGLAGGMAGILLQSAFEWVLRQTCNFYQLMLVFAIVGALYKRPGLFAQAAPLPEENPAVPGSR